VRDEAAGLQARAFVVGDAHDRGKNYHFADLFSHHNVEFYELAQDIEAGGEEFKAGRAWVIPTEQTEYKFIEAMFETRTEFADSIFYDVSTWTLPFAFNMPFAELSQRQFGQNLLGEQLMNRISGRRNYRRAEVIMPTCLNGMSIMHREHSTAPENGRSDQSRLAALNRSHGQRSQRVRLRLYSCRTWHPGCERGGDLPHPSNCR
jgi:hypothetical protein